MSAVADLSQAAAKVAEVGRPAVVRIGREGGRGAGAVMAPGLVLTSAHNLRGPEATVTFADGRVERGQARGVDGDGDLAVIAVDTGEVTPLAWSAGSPELGDVVFALGPVPSSEGARVTVGTVSAVGAAFRGPRGRLITGGIEHTAPVGRGSSGGPILDPDGHLVGVNTHRPGEGFYLALPATDELRTRVDALSRGEEPTRHRLGVALTPPHVAARLRAAVGLPPRDGVLIREVGENTPAAAAGLVRGDLILAAGGQATPSIDAVLSALDAVSSEGVLALTVLRGAEEVTVDVRFGGAPAAAGGGGGGSATAGE